MILWEHRNEHALIPGQAALSFSRDPVPAMLCSRPSHHLIGDLVPACTIAYAIHPLLPMLSSPTPDAIPLQFEMHLPSKSKKSLLREIRDQASVDHKNQDFTLKDETFFKKKVPFYAWHCPFLSKSFSPVSIWASQTITPLANSSSAGVPSAWHFPFQHHRNVCNCQNCRWPSTSPLRRGWGSWVAPKGSGKWQLLLWPLQGNSLPIFPLSLCHSPLNLSFRLRTDRTKSVSQPPPAWHFLQPFYCFTTHEAFFFS